MYFDSSESRLNGWINAIREKLSADGADTVGMAVKLRGLSGVGLITTDDGIRAVDGLTVRSLLCDCPDSALLWRTLYEVLCFGGELDAEGFYRIVTENYNAATNEVNVGAVKREINKLSPKINDKNIETRFPFIEDAVYIWVSALGFKPVKATTLNTVNICEGLLSGARFEKGDAFFDVGTAIKSNNFTSALKLFNDKLIGNGKPAKGNGKPDGGVFGKIAEYSQLLERYVARQTENNEVTEKTFRTVDGLIYDIMAMASEISGKIRATESFTALHDELEYLRSELVGKKRSAERKMPEIELLNYLDFAEEKLRSFSETLEAAGSLSECTALINDCNGCKSKAAALWSDFTDVCEEADALKHQNRFNQLVSDLNNLVLSVGAKKLQIEKEIRERDFNEMRAQFQSVITNTRIYAEQYQSAKLDLVHSRSEAAKLVSETNANISRLKNLREEAKKRGNEFTSTVPMQSIDELEKTLEKYCAEAKAKSKDTSLPAEIAEDITIDKNGWNMTVDENLSVQFSLMDEDYSELMFDNDKSGGEATGIHDYSAYHNLVDSAVDVKRQPIFSDYGDITVYPYVKPFGYQVDSVRTMLSRFEGRGIFGDQVGLGKTLQALLTAHVMYKCGAIRNAVIVVNNKKNVEQWRREAENKFRDENGAPYFELHPAKDDRDNPDNYYKTFEKLKTALEEDRETRRENTLKLYFTTLDGGLKGPDAIAIIQESNRAADLIYEATRTFKENELPENFDALNCDVSLERNREKLKHIADLLLEQFRGEVSQNDKIKKFISNFAEDYKCKVKGKFEDTTVYLGLDADPNANDFSAEWDESAEWSITEQNKNLSFAKLGEYNEKLEKIRARILEIDKQLEKAEKKNLYNKQRFIDLLIVDEVQGLLATKSDVKKDADGKDFKALGPVQEFIARIQKKYCILISATPIRNDLSDIFNLAYMVDKNRLGDTREEAERRFYNGYCGGCRSLSEMANAADSKKKFQTLNGLINSMFTRKRLYDKDVIASMRRQCATLEEIAYAEEHGRDDYGGAKFYKLIKALALESKYAETPDEKILAEIDGLRKEIFPDVKQENYHKYLQQMAQCINNSFDTVIKRVQMEFREASDTNMNLCERFISVYDRLRSREEKNEDVNSLKNIIHSCNLLCSYINRGLLDFYRARHDFSTVFLSDYIDWRRPVKRGVKVSCPAGVTKSRLIDMFADAFVPDDEDDFKQDGNALSYDDVILLQQSKVLYYEKSVDNRKNMYRAIRKAKQTFGDPRNIYITMSDAAERDYSAEELVDLCRFGSRAAGSASHRAISAKSVSARTWKEQLFIDTWKADGKLQMGENIADVNRKRFTDYSDDSGVWKPVPNNWNAIYFMDGPEKAGTDLNAANALVMAQLDDGTNAYLDPLDMEQLIGRISRTGQTEECVLFTCLYNGNDNTNNPAFNEVYYDILTDKKGFDLFGACQTEVDFVVPVVMACARRLFSPEHSYRQSEEGTEKFLNDKSDFKAVFSGARISLKAEKFPELLKYAFENKGKVWIFCTDNDWVEENGEPELGADMVESIDGEMQTRVLNPIEAIKKMIRVYAKVLSHETTGKKQK